VISREAINQIDLYIVRFERRHHSTKMHRRDRERNIKKV